MLLRSYSRQSASLFLRALPRQDMLDFSSPQLSFSLLRSRPSIYYLGGPSWSGSSGSGASASAVSIRVRIDSTRGDFLSGYTFNAMAGTYEILYRVL